MDDHLPLQIPNFVYQHAPTLVPGGGAEVVPVANSQWFVHNGFTPAALDDSYYDRSDHQSTHHDSTSSPFDFNDQGQHHHQHDHHQQHLTPQQPPDLSVFLAPSPLGLPVYSQSGFDILALLARITHRPNPRIHLGPVDLTTAFCVVDTRRFDHPIVYCSRTFCTLTGYSEQEVLGRNCRFLQAPGGEVAKGSPRRHTSPIAVNHLRKSLLADKECQTSIINYRKDGAAFVNLVTVIPVPPLDDGEVIYQVGFQVDLNEQPSAIMEKLRDGSYLVENDHSVPAAPTQPQNQPYPGARRITVQSAKDRKAHAIPPIVMSKTLRRLLGDPSFIRSIPISYPALSAPSSTSATTTLTLLEDGSGASTLHSQHANHPLHLMLLEAAPDFIHVVSLKGDFLYVAPNVRRVLGFEAAEMQGKGLANYAHPEDVVPLMRELKEASSMGPPPPPGEAAAPHQNGTTSGMNASSPPLSQPHPRPVDLLFRCRTKFGRYVWVEARGRLYVEPGKGRKAIILAGRAREMTCLKWADVGRAGGVARGMKEAVAPNSQDAGYPGGVGADTVHVEGAQGVAPPVVGGGGTGTGTGAGGEAPAPASRTRAQEAWGLLAGSGARTAVFASVGRGMRDVLGWTAEDLLGRGVMRTLVLEEGLRTGAEDEQPEGGLVVRSIDEAVQGMRQAQKWLREQRRLRVAGEHFYHPQHAPVDLGRVKKVACRLRTKAGGALDCWVVIYRADVDEGDVGAEDMNGVRQGSVAEGSADDCSMDGQVAPHTPLHRDAGASITPAPLVFQIRVMGAETVRVPALGNATASLQSLGVPYGVPAWKTSPSSLSGAMGIPTSSSSSSSPPALSPSSSTSTSTASQAALANGSGDVFAELAVARGSSWQYELQQLRITNMRLKEELAELEAAEAAMSTGASNSSGRPAAPHAQPQQLAMVVQPQPPAAPQRAQGPVYAQTQPAQSYPAAAPAYEPVPMYQQPSQQQQQPDMYPYERAQPQRSAMDMDIDYGYGEQPQHQYYSPIAPSPSASNTYLHHPQPQPLAGAPTLGGDDVSATFSAGIRAALAQRQAQTQPQPQVYQQAPQPQQQQQHVPVAVAEHRPIHKLPAPRTVHPRPSLSSLPHPAAEQIQRHILPSGGLVHGAYHPPPQPQHPVQHLPQPHHPVQQQHQHQPHQQQQSHPPAMPVSMPMSLSSAARWGAAAAVPTFFPSNGAADEVNSRKRSWSAVDRGG